MSEDTWRTIAEGEAAAVYAYGVLIPRLQSAQRPKARDALIFHSRQRDAAIAKFREAHGAYAGALALAEGKDKASTAAMKRIESRLAGLGATVQKEEDEDAQP